MKKVILALLFITGMAFTTHAQQAANQNQAPNLSMGKTPEQRAMHMTRILAKKLNLTAKQAQRINRIYLTNATEQDSIRNYPSADRRADAQQKKYLKRTTQKEIMKVLSADQQQQFIQYKKMAKQKHNNKGNAAPAPAPDGDNDSQG